MASTTRPFLPHLFMLPLILVFFTTTAIAALGGGVDLRIHPIGDSITFGYQSSDGNGYRNALLQKFSGNNVRYIGSQRAGNMANNQCDGYSGFKISEIAAKIGPALSQRPNVILLMAGTNDVNGNDNVDSAPSRLGSLLDQIKSACPDAVVILAKITPISDSAAEARSQNFNSAIDGIAKSRTNSGQKIVVVDMQNSRNGLSTGDLIDGLHPTDNGYAKMANVWWDGLNTASSQNLITAPQAGTSGSGVGAASCNGNLFWYNTYGTIASGIGKADNAFTAGWQPVGTVASGIGAGAGVRIADMDGDGQDDYIWVNADSGAAFLYLNGGYSNGKVNWVDKGKIATGIGDGAGVRFADITGDGRADYIWIGKDGKMTAYINNGPISSGGWNFLPLGDIGRGLDIGTRDTIVFADMNGDGRADYNIVEPGGAIRTWIATGGAPEPKWVYIGTIASGVGDGAGVRLADINGDGRADYIWINNASASFAYINQRGMNDLKPVWLDAKQVGSGVGVGRGNITFGDLTGDGKADFLVIGNNTGSVDLLVNTGGGGAYQIGDQVVFADIDGDGADDYISIGPNGALEVYSNGGPVSNANNGWNWFPLGTIASGVAPRRQIRIADLDGDGRADYLIVDDKSGAVSAYINGGKGSGSAWNWYPTGQIASGVARGRQIRFADLNGDGKADYIIVDAVGAVSAYINGGKSSNGWNWYPTGTIASGVGMGAEIRFADINGDGFADYLVLNTVTGAVEMYINGGQASNGWNWYPKGQIATGVGATGQSVVFGGISSRRADYCVVTPATGAVYLWANGCDGTVGNGSAGSPSTGSGSDNDTDIDDGIYEPIVDPYFYPNCDATFTDLDQLDQQKDSVPDSCMHKYLIDVVIAMWSGAMSKYQTLVNSGYDDKFNIYQQHMKDEVPITINAFMGNGHADDFFDCVENIKSGCCLKTCRSNGQCAFCSKADNCVDGQPQANKITCPTVYKDGPSGITSNSKVPNTTYTLRNSDGFYKAMSDGGIVKDWIKFDNIDLVVSQSCQNAKTDVQGCKRRDDIWFWNYPSPGNVVIANPKDVVTGGQSNAQSLLDQLRAIQFLGQIDAFLFQDDILDAATMPAFSTMAAVESMELVITTANQIQEEQRKEMIVDFVTGFLFLVPFVGEAAGAVGLTAARVALQLVEIAGDVGLGIYGIIQDPKSAAVTVISTLLGAGPGRDKWTDAANSRRGMKSTDIDKLGSIKTRLGKVQGTRTKFCAASF